MATPHVAGVAALAWGKCPPLSYSQLKTRILDKSDYLSSLKGKYVSNGRVNAYNVIYDPSPPSAPPSNLSATPTAWDIIKLIWQDNSNNEIGFEVERKSEYEPWWQEIDIVGPNVTIYYDQDDFDPDTFYYYRVRAYNPSGNSSLGVSRVSVKRISFDEKSLVPQSAQ